MLPCRLHQVGAGAVSLLAPQRDGSADPGLRLPPFGDHGAGRRLPPGAAFAAARAAPALDHHAGDFRRRDDGLGRPGGPAADRPQANAGAVDHRLARACWCLLLGIGGETGAVAAIVYFVAHAFYKAGFFLVVGLIDHETGVRDITALGGLRDKMALSFIAAILAGFVDARPAAGARLPRQGGCMPGASRSAEWRWSFQWCWWSATPRLARSRWRWSCRPFMGPLIPTPKAPHEGPLAMLAGPLIFGDSSALPRRVLSGWTGVDAHRPRRRGDRRPRRIAICRFRARSRRSGDLALGADMGR